MDMQLLTQAIRYAECSRLHDKITSDYSSDSDKKQLTKLVNSLPQSLRELFNDVYEWEG